MKNSVIIGESEIPDCPDSTNGDYCEVHDKIGLLSYAAAVKGKGPHPTSDSALPLLKIKGDACFGGRALFNNIKFQNYESATTA